MAMCPHCRRTPGVTHAMNLRKACPHCGGALFESPTACCIPGCNNLADRGSGDAGYPICRTCGSAIASRHLHEAAWLDEEMSRRRKRREEEASAKRSGESGEAVVYYVQLAEDRIKIGYSTQVWSRLSSLRVHPTALLSWEPGGQPVEAERHRQFRSDRITRNREDFRPSQALMDWIADLRKIHGVPREAELPDTSVVSSRRVEAWRADAHRC